MRLNPAWPRGSVPCHPKYWLDDRGLKARVLHLNQLIDSTVSRGRNFNTFCLPNGLICPEMQWKLNSEEFGTCHFFPPLYPISVNVGAGADNHLPPGRWPAVSVDARSRYFTSHLGNIFFQKIFTILVYSSPLQKLIYKNISKIQNPKSKNRYNIVVIIVLETGRTTSYCLDKFHLGSGFHDNLEWNIDFQWDRNWKVLKTYHQLKQE